MARKKGDKRGDVLRNGQGGPEHAPDRRPWALDHLPRPRFVVQAHPAPPGMPKTEWPTLREVVAYRLWKLTQAGMAADGTEKAQRAALCYALAELPARPVPGDVIAWHRGLVEAYGMAPASANRALAYLSTAYEVAREFGGPLANPCKLVQAYGEPAPAGRALGGPDHAAEVYERTRVVCDAREKVALALLRYAGLRRGELLGLYPSDVDVRAGLLRVERQRIGRARTNQPKPRAKSRAGSRMIPLALLPERERGELAELANLGGGSYRERNQFGPERASPYLFPWSDETVRNGLLRKLRAVAPELFPAGHALHQWRHVALETVDEATDDEREVQRLAGHASRRSTERYLRGRTGQRMSAETAAKVRQQHLKYAPERILKAVAPRRKKSPVFPRSTETGGTGAAPGTDPRSKNRAQAWNLKSGAPKPP